MSRSSSEGGVLGPILSRRTHADGAVPRLDSGRLFSLTTYSFVWLNRLIVAQRYSWPWNVAASTFRHIQKFDHPKSRWSTKRLSSRTYFNGLYRAFPPPETLRKSGSYLDNRRIACSAASRIRCMLSHWWDLWWTYLHPQPLQKPFLFGVRCLVLRWPISASDSKPGVVNDGLQGFLADEALESFWLMHDWCSRIFLLGNSFRGKARQICEKFVPLSKPPNGKKGPWQKVRHWSLNARIHTQPEISETNRNSKSLLSLILSNPVPDSQSKYMKLPTNLRQLLKNQVDIILQNGWTWEKCQIAYRLNEASTYIQNTFW